MSDQYGSVTVSYGLSNELRHLAGSTSNIQAQKTDLVTRPNGDKADVDGFIRLTYSPQVTSFSNKCTCFALGALHGPLTERVVEKGRILYSNDVGLLSTATLTLTHVMHIIPRQRVFESVLNTMVMSINAIRTSLETEYLRTWWHNKNSPAGMLLYINAEDE